MTPGLAGILSLHKSFPTMVDWEKLSSNVVLGVVVQSLSYAQLFVTP